MSSPKRNISLKSIWDEGKVFEILEPKHAFILWKHLLKNPDLELIDVKLEDIKIPAKSFKYLIDNGFVRKTVKIVERSESSRGDTTKLLIELEDGHRVETVVMKHQSRATVCLSSQIGCKMGCKFCATGTMGIIGDLTSGEIVEQFMLANDVIKIRNVVYMGMGEPLNNYQNVKESLHFMLDSHRFGLSARHITMSTVGVIKNMYKLTEDFPNVSLALSLHAPNQETRLKIVPSASAHKIEKLMEAIDNYVAYTPSKSRKWKKGDIVENEYWCNSKVTVDYEEEDNNTVADDWFDGSNEKDYYGSSSNNSGNNNINNNDGYSGEIKVDLTVKNRKRKVMIEYILIRDVNDLEEHAHELGRLLHSRRGSILLNLIPYNPTDVCEDFLPPTSENIKIFADICRLPEHNIHTRIRTEMGQDIAGACGQLALTKSNPSNVNDTDHDVEDFLSNKKTKNNKTINSNNKASKLSRYPQYTLYILPVIAIVGISLFAMKRIKK
jgi:adenine C2-methylase RlmN of 23S rRNA A2503 and tRNA A37